jgi:rhodanese-related sulfurtransferase
MGRHLCLFAIAASLVLGACGPNAEESADTPISAVEESADTPTSVADASAGTPISGAQLAERIEAGSAPLILDVRNRDEYAEAHIPGAINIPRNELSKRLAELPSDKSQEIVVHCYGGRRAGLAEETLRGSGYSNVRDLSGHWQEWQAARLPTE